MSKLLCILRRDCAGMSGIGAMLLFAVVVTAFLLVCEFVYAFNIKQSVDIELTRAVNTAVDLAMSDEHRKDKILELDPVTAYDSFYSYLYNDMKLTSRLELVGREGGSIYSLDIVNLDIQPAPPEIKVVAAVSVKPVFFSKIAPVTINFNVRGNSINRRID